MERSDFFSTKLLEESVTRRKKSEKENAVSWLEIRWLHFEKNEPFKIFYKNTLNEEDYSYEAINITPYRKGAPKHINNIGLPLLYDDFLPVSDKKKKDMEDLFQFIPPCHQEYFKRIIGNENVEDIGPLEVEDDKID